jgi:hypothetical protein
MFSFGELASTFKSTHGFVPGYQLGQTSRIRMLKMGSLTTTLIRTLSQSATCRVVARAFGAVEDSAVVVMNKFEPTGPYVRLGHNDPML